MLIDPASNVFTPPTVVILTRSKSPDNGTKPAVMLVVATFDVAKTPCVDQVSPSTEFKIIEPLLIAALVSLPPRLIWNPLVLFTVATALERTEEPPKYPVDVTLPAPSWIRTELVPLVDTPLSMTVTRFAQAGIPVKSIEVPDAL